MTEKLGPKFIFDHMVLYQIIMDKEFWATCPEFAALKPQRLIYRAKIRESVLSTQPNCGTCSTLGTILKPFQLLFTQRLVALFYEDVKQTENFVSYITRKRGYRPVPIIVYTKDAEGRTLEMEL